MDKKSIIRKIEEEIENLKLHIYMLEMIMVDFKDIEND